MNKKLAAPFVSRNTGGKRGLSSNPFNEGIQCTQAQFDAVAEHNPALKSKNRRERSDALTREITTGELAKYRRR